MRIDPAERTGLNPVFDLARGDAPLIVSVPHDGRLLMPGQAAGMTPAGLALPDTDWHVRRLYEFAAGMGATVIAANYSRYVVDLNRPPGDEAPYPGRVSTGLCPASTFAGEAIYAGGGDVGPEEKSRRVAIYWQPYHDRLREILDAAVARFGRVLLWDAHSIGGQLPRLFSGTLPDLNVGTDGGKSCAPQVESAVFGAARGPGYSSVLNGRFKGGYITRHYGNPAAGIHAVQLEIAQQTYLARESADFDPDAAGPLQKTIQNMILAGLEALSSG